VFWSWTIRHCPSCNWKTYVSQVRNDAAPGLGRLDGSALLEHADPRQGEQPDWGTLIFNYGRHEVRNFLLTNALYWLESFHIDGLRVDAVASMLYRDYSREDGQWVPNQFGGRENLEAIDFLRELNTLTHQEHPGTVIIAEESTAFPAVSRPTWVGGLGFTYKWNMGWMHDILTYAGKDPLFRRWEHQHLTFSMLYAWNENFVLPLSHDEVVHGKGSLLNKMPGDRWQKFANLRLLFAAQSTTPGKKLVFMGGELGQWREWSHDSELDWGLLDDPSHRGLSKVVGDLNRLYASEPALHQRDCDERGFRWVNGSDSERSVLAFLRLGEPGTRPVLVVLSFTPVVRGSYRVGVPLAGHWAEVMNTDADAYGGSGVGNLGGLDSIAEGWDGFAQRLEITLPPLGAVVFVGPSAWNGEP